MKIALIGSPNVGKSLLFHHLTGQYVTVSNYPGTTVEVSRGGYCDGIQQIEVIDTPGIYSFYPISGDEKVTRDLLLSEKPDLVLHIVDAKNLQRMILITLQLLEAGLKTILVLNMMDELRRRKMDIKIDLLAKRLQIPVIPTACNKGEGIDLLKKQILSTLYPSQRRQSPQKDTNYQSLKIEYPPTIMDKLRSLERVLEHHYPISKRSVALFLLQEDKQLWQLVRSKEKVDNIKRIQRILQEMISANQVTVTQNAFQITQTYQRLATQLLTNVIKMNHLHRPFFQHQLSKICTRPLTGIPILIIVLYLGIYKFVGGFGAGILVDFLEGTLFRQWLNPLWTTVINQLIPWQWLQSLFVGEYGLLTLGLRYAVAIILPIVGTFFFIFSLLEDTGYLPRLALLSDRVFKCFGLNGRAVIPMVLGLGCDTMATVTTRILESRRERIIATFLLALAIPCSAQLGVIMGLLSQVPGGLWIWFSIIILVLVVTGYLLGRLMPGKSQGFYMEIPLLRWPNLANIFVKTRARMVWYFAEILPVFLLSSLFIWVGQLTGFFQLLLKCLEPLMLALGLPEKTAVTFLFGFFRRDYGAAGLFDLYYSGGLSDASLIVSAVTLTLFIPCLAQMAVMMKEHGVKVGLIITSFIFPFAFLVGFLLHQLLLLF